MSPTSFTEEPEILSESQVPTLTNFRSSDPVVSGQSSLSHGPELEEGWNDKTWTHVVLEQACIQDSKGELKQRLAEFMKEASPQEQSLLEESRSRVSEIKGRAQQASATLGNDVSLADKLKSAWRSTTEVAYEYIKILDVMVGQAPEYVGLAYGAVKIILVVQINHEEVKQKCKDYLEQVKVKFEIIDHLTSHITSSQLVSLVAQLYSLFYRFLAKAVKYYTQSRLKIWAKAITKPWKRFQDIVDSIEQTLANIRELAQYSGLLDGHANTIMIRRNLLLLQQHSVKVEKVIELVEDLRSRMEVTTLRFKKKEDIAQTENVLRQSTAARLNEPALEERGRQSEPDTTPDRIASTDFSGLHDVLFSELQLANQHTKRSQQAREQLPEMKAYRSERRNISKSGMALAWAESPRSEILWVDGYQLLNRASFNASFVFPLLQLVESRFENVITLRHFSEESYKESDKYLIMMQDLLSQLLQRNPSVVESRKASITRNKTSTTQGLWTLLSELLEEVNAHCVLLIIGGVDNLVHNKLDADKTRSDIVERLHVLKEKRLVKVILTLNLPQPPSATIESVSSLTLYKHQVSPKRTLSFDSMQSSLPVISLQLTQIQEKRCQVVSFMQLPMLYTPGSIVYTRIEKYLQAFVILELSGMDQILPGTYSPLRIRAWSVDHNGTYICKRHWDFHVSQFLGMKETTALQYVPAGYLLDEAAQRTELIARGRHYWSMASGSHHRQIGRTNGLRRIIIDQRSRPIESDLIESFTEQLPPEQTKNVKPRFLMLTPPEVAGFDMQALAWGAINLQKSLMCDVARCKPVIFEKSIFDSLVLDSGRKDVIMALARRHIEEDSVHSADTQDEESLPRTAESISPRNTGFIMLLSGAPGTGKTLTVECIAEATGRPLIVLTSGDIGFDAMTVEQRLSKWLRLAELWRAFIIIDEADIFLTRRERVDLQMKGVVSVFDKLIKSYRGFLFLMANQIGDFDESVRSHIHVALHYDALTPESRLQIWEHFFRRLEIKRKETNIQTYSARKYVFESTGMAELELNGRQIRNAFQTAVALAEYRFSQHDGSDLKPMFTLEKEDFEKVYEASKAFKGYMETSNSGEEGAGRAHRKDESSNESSDSP